MAVVKKVDWVLAGVVLFGLAAFGFWVTWRKTEPAAPPAGVASRPGQSGNETTIRLATSKNLWCAVTLVAIRYDFFRQEGVSVTPAYQAAGRLNMDALLGNSAEVVNVVETNLAYQALKGEKDLQVQGKIVEARDYALMTRRSAGISEPSQFRGRSIAYAQATGAESFLFWFLERNRIAISDVRLMPLQPAGLVDNFLGGGSDAAVAWEPFASAIRSHSEGLGPEFGSGEDGFRGLMLVATRTSWAAANTAILDRFQKALTRAAQFVADEPAKAQAVVAEETGLPIRTVQEAWNRFQFGYNQPTASNRKLVTEVVARIQRNVPGMAEKAAQPADSYFLKDVR